jgi:serpin B
MNEDLISLGAKTAFSSEADFSGISPHDLYISDVVHQAMLEVNEEGTVAAAATEVILDLKSLVVEEVIDFICDRPFMIIIHDNVDKCVLFVGKYLNPV